MPACSAMALANTSARRIWLAVLVAAMASAVRVPCSSRSVRELPCTRMAKGAEDMQLLLTGRTNNHHTHPWLTCHAMLSWYIIAHKSISHMHCVAGPPRRSVLRSVTVSAVRLDCTVTRILCS